MTEVTFTVQGKDFFELRRQAAAVLKSFIVEAVEFPDYSMGVYPESEVWGSNVPALWEGRVTARIP